MVQTHVMNALPRRLIAHLWASQETRISLSHLTSTTSQATSAPFLCSELPIRYTHILRLLSSLNADSLQTPLIRNVTQRYLMDICSILHPSLRQTSPRAFSQTIHRLRQRQASSLIRLRYALASSSTATPHSFKLLEHINAISLGIHFLLDQHVSWHLQTGNHAQVLCPVEIAQQAVKDARQVCGDTFGEVPLISIKKSDSHALKITHVPNVLHRMLYESILLSLKSHCMQQPVKTRWWQRPARPAIQLDIFGGATSIGYRLTNPTACIPPHELNHDIPRDPMGIPSCASVLRQVGLKEKKDDEQEEWSMWSGWQMAKALACHFGGNLDIVSADGLGSTVYLALDRDTRLVERYPSVLPGNHHYNSPHLTLRHATSQLDAFLYAVADPDGAIQHHTTTPAIRHHAVSLTAAVGHA